MNGKSINWKIVGAIALLVITTLFAYRSHFDNGFYFDDWHTIRANCAVHGLSEWPTYFTDATTFSTLPLNQTYRPMVTLLNALNYASDTDTFWFHVTNFSLHIFNALLLIGLIYRLTRQFWTGWWVALLFALHAANAETVNYIIARSDLLVTFFCLAGLLVYSFEKGRRYGLYLPLFVLGLWSKQSALMFIALAWVMHFLWYTSSNESLLSRWWTTLKSTWILWMIGGVLFGINQELLIPDRTISFNAHASPLMYITGQIYVVARYLLLFILPIDLSVDPDLTTAHVIQRPFVLIGLLVHMGMGYWIYNAWKKGWKLAVLGICWFYISHVPTSLVPFYQITNDHRMYLSFAGIVLAVGDSLTHLYALGSDRFKRGLWVLCISVLLGHIYGTQERCEVWNTEISLWEDGLKKSPKNPRAHLSLGWAYLDDGQIELADKHIMAAFKMNPRDAYTRIAMGLVATHHKEKNQAERHFELSLKIYPDNPDCYWWYAESMMEFGANSKAKRLVKEGLGYSPNHAKLHALNNSLDH